MRWWLEGNTEWQPTQQLSPCCHFCFCQAAELGTVMSKRNAGKTEDRLPGRRSGMVTVTQSCHGHSNAKCKKITHHKRQDLRRRALGQAFCSVQKHQERETTAPREKSLARAIPPCTAAPPAFQTSHISIWLEGETQTSDIITRSVLHPDRRYCPKHPAGPAFTWQWAIGIRHGEKQRLTTVSPLPCYCCCPWAVGSTCRGFQEMKV